MADIITIPSGEGLLIAGAVQGGKKLATRQVRKTLMDALIVNKSPLSRRFQALFGSGGRFNRGPNLRVGIGRDGGEFVFRVGGQYLQRVPAPVRKLLGIRETRPGEFKIDVFRFGPIPKIGE